MIFLCLLVENFRPRIWRFFELTLTSWQMSMSLFGKLHLLSLCLSWSREWNFFLLFLNNFLNIWVRIHCCSRRIQILFNIIPNASFLYLGISLTFINTVFNISLKHLLLLVLNKFFVLVFHNIKLSFKLIFKSFLLGFLFFFKFFALMSLNLHLVLHNYSVKFINLRLGLFVSLCFSFIKSVQGVLSSCC